jgi:hypothetical protein
VQPASPPQSQSTANPQSTDAIIGDLLSHLDEGKAAAAPAPEAAALQSPPPRAAQPAAQPAAAPVAGATPATSGSRLDTWDSDISTVKSKVPTWDNGSGVVLKFLNEGQGTRLTLIYVDTTPPVFKEEAGLWIVQAKATANGTTLGHMMLLLKSLEPGRYEGGPGKQDVVLAAGMGETWEPKAPGTTWSINDGSWCEITLRAGQNPGDLEGDFRGKLVDNSGNGYHNIEAGYIYINR